MVRDFLAPSDTITIRFGDRRGGSPGIRLQTYCESEFKFRVFADPIATYDYVALPESPTVRIVPGPGVRWQAIVPTMARAGEPFRLVLKIDDKWGNPSDRVEALVRLVADAAIEGLPQTVLLSPRQFGAVLTGLRCTAPGDRCIRIVDESGNELCRANPLRIAAAGTILVHYWGDTQRVAPAQFLPDVIHYPDAQIARRCAPQAGHHGAELTR